MNAAEFCHYCAEGHAMREAGFDDPTPRRSPARIVMHDRRGCYWLCSGHARWRETTSGIGGHSSDCPYASSIGAQVREFIRTFQPDMMPAALGIPSDKIVRLGSKLVMEEALELLAATYDLSDPKTVAGMSFIEAKSRVAAIIEFADVRVNMPEFVDATSDIDYVVEWLRITFGIDGVPFAREVHRSNMAKVWPDGKVHRREDGKVLKPEGWTPPDIVGELRKQGWNG